MINAISLGSFGVLKSAVALFRPTPSKLHYLFSMHDVKKVCFFKLIFLFLYDLCVHEI